MGKRKPYGVQLSGDDQLLKAALRRVADGAHRDGVREVAEAWMHAYGLPTRGTIIHNIPGGLHIKRAGE